MSQQTFPNFLVAKFRCDCGCEAIFLERSPDTEIDEDKLRRDSICAACHKPMKRIEVPYGTKYMEEL